jgi:hypothetical protein
MVRTILFICLLAFSTHVYAQKAQGPAVIIATSDVTTDIVSTPTIAGLTPLGTKIQLYSVPAGSYILSSRKGTVACALQLTENSSVTVTFTEKGTACSCVTTRPAQLCSIQRMTEAAPVKPPGQPVGPANPQASTTSTRAPVQDARFILGASQKYVPPYEMGKRLQVVNGELVGTIAEDVISFVRECLRSLGVRTAAGLVRKNNAVAWFEAVQPMNWSRIGHIVVETTAYNTFSQGTQNAVRSCGTIPFKE